MSKVNGSSNGFAWYGRHLVLFWMLFLLLMVSLEAVAQNEAGSLDTRRALVAGQFYPADPLELKRMVDSFYSKALVRDFKSPVVAILVPHAGLVYSGQVAVQGYKALPEHINRFFIVASNHNADTPPFVFSVPAEKTFETPLGKVRVSPLVSEFKKNSFFTTVPEAESSHVIEVQLPFLQLRYPDFEIIPIITGEVSRKELRMAARMIEPYLDEHTAIIVSSDLSHYHSAAKAVALDQSCIRSIAAVDLEQVTKCEACSLPAVIILLEIAAKKGWGGEVLDYKHSGDVTGDRTAVVGYSAIAFSPGHKPLAVPTAQETQAQLSKQEFQSDIPPEDKEVLLKMSRSVLENAVKLKRKVTVSQYPVSPAATKDRGCFVTLQKSGELRGCIGSIYPEGPLNECVLQNTVNAAKSDPRFPPVDYTELSAIDIEISILDVPVKQNAASPQQRLNELVPLRDGVILRRGPFQATYLPQVWEQLPDKRQFLSHLCEKGGMPDDCWQDLNTEIFTYKAEVIREKAK